jgi:predicted component of type VI protein secretion system
MALASAQVVVLDVTAAYLIALAGSHQEDSMNPPQLRQLSFAALMSALVLVVGCQTAPVQEMSDARQAISAARDAGAADHAVVELQAAVDHLQSAERNLNQRQYESARRDAVQAKQDALNALQRSESSQDDDL